MDWFEVFLVVIGAVIGFLLSILTTIVNKAFDKQGKLRLYYKLVHVPVSCQEAGFIDDGIYLSLVIPVFFEFQNTSNVTRVIRDVCLYLYNNGKCVCKMMQMQYAAPSDSSQHSKDFGGDKNSYSFVLPPVSIQKQECEFAYKISSADKEKYLFDEIRFAYFDENNRFIESQFCKINGNWKNISFPYSNEYILLNCKRKAGGRK